MLTVVNLSHPFHSDAVVALADMAGDAIKIVNVPVQVDLEAPLEGVVKTLVDEIEKTVGNLRNIDLVNPPGLNYAAMAILPEIAKRTSGYIPNVIRLIRQEGTPPKFMPVEIVHSHVFRLSYANFNEYGEPEPYSG